MVATAALSATISHRGEPLRFWITISNDTAQSICAVTVTIPPAPGYADATVTTTAAGNSAPPGCPPSDRPISIVAGLRPGQSATVQGKLDTLDSHDAQILEAVVSWTNPAGVPSQTVVALGQNSIESTRQRIARAAYDVVKDFALPLLLVIITLLATRWDKKRENARKKADEAMEDAKKRCRNKAYLAG